MKKLFAIALCVMMLCAAILPMTVSAAGMILFHETFDEPIESNWIWDGSLFECIDGKLEGYCGAVVHQGQYEDEDGNNKVWGPEFAMKIDCWALDDDAGNGENWLGIWWADYLSDMNEEDGDGRIVYFVRYDFLDHKPHFCVVFEGDGGKAIGDNFIEEEGEYSIDYPIEGFPEQKMDLSNPDKVTLGMRVAGGYIYAYVNDQLVLTHEAERGTDCGKDSKCPILLWNIGNYCRWDDMYVSTADYDLFNEGTIPTGPAATDTQAATESGEVPATKAPETTKIEEVVVTEIGEDGEVVTKIETVIVTNAPAPDTQKQPTNPQGGAQTGDMAVIVIAVMAVALGAAVVVKKVNE